MGSDLHGQVALVTGAGRGIGRVTALTLAQHGATAIVGDIDDAAAKEVEQEIKEAGLAGRAVHLDVTNRAEVDATVDTLLAELGRIDILVNNAGVWRFKLFVDSTVEDWDVELKVCLYGVLHCTHAVLPQMIERGAGRIISIASGAGRVGQAQQAVYSAAKAGVIGFTKALAKEVGRHQITVNAIAPGATRSEGQVERERRQAEQFSREELEERRRRQLALYPLRRLGEPQDIANAVLFLASPLADFVTGQCLAVDGGYTMI